MISPWPLPLLQKTQPKRQTPNVLLLLHQPHRAVALPPGRERGLRISSGITMLLPSQLPLALCLAP
jgi:hypothetical protein